MKEIYKLFIKPFLFHIDPEKSHEILKKFFKLPFPLDYVNNEILKIKIKNLKLKNPLGLAAGFDKNAEIANFLSYLNFGYLTLGSVLLNPSMGNPKPRIIRYEKKLSLINSMGLPSVGLKKFLENLSKVKVKIPISISIAGNSFEEYIILYENLSKVVNIIEINVSCPNTQNGKLFQSTDNFEKLIKEISKIKRNIIFVKISPPLNKIEKENLIELIRLSIKYNVDGITAINTIQIKEKSFATGYGGLSGKLIYNKMLETIKIIYSESKGKLIINSCGGIFNGKDAFKAILNGAFTIQIFTSLIYEGITLPNIINKELIKLLKFNNFSSIKEAIGYLIK